MSRTLRLPIHARGGCAGVSIGSLCRNRYNSVINKARLKRNGVRVISVRENISDDANGISIEGVLESMVEYYSAELSQKIRRGMDLNAQKGLSIGSNPGLGFAVNANRELIIEPEGGIRCP